MSWSGAEKRRFVRANFPCKIIIHTPKENTITTKTENISAGGVRVIISEELAISSMVDLELFVNNKTISCKGRVVWMVPNKNLSPEETNIYDTGIEFYQISPKDREAIKQLVKSILSKEQ